MKKSYLLFILFISAYTKSEIAFTQLQGLYNPIPENKKHCSPLHGFNWWHEGIIQNIYRFGDEAENTTKLIQEMFYLQPDNITFDVTTLPRKVAKHFTASTYGKIITLLDQYKTPLSAAQQEALKKELYTTISTDLAFDQLVAQSQESISDARKQLDQITKLAKRRAKLNVLIVRYQKKLQESGPNNEWQRNIAAAEKELLNIEPLVAQRKKIERTIHGNDLNNKRLDDFITYLVGSLQETNQQRFVPYTTHAILLAAFWKSAQNKSDFVTYFKIIDPTFNINAGSWNQEFTRADFESFNAQLGNDPSVIQNNYEMSSFYGLARQAWASDLLPIIISGIGNAQYLTFFFADCGESSLRNFFDILIFNPQKEIFDFSLLKNTAEKNKLIILPALEQYYAIYNQMPYIQTKPYYDAWAGVMAQLPGVHYNHPEEYEISPGLSNMLNVFNALIFGNDPTYRAMSNSEKLDYLVAKVSRPGFSLSWRAQKGTFFKEDPNAPAPDTSHEAEQSVNVNHYEVGITIIFTINDTQEFIWKFDDDHFVIEKPEKQSSPIDTQTALVLAKNMHHAANLTAQNLIGWFTHADNASETIALMPSATDRTFLFMTLPLKNANTLAELWPLILQTNGLPHPIIKRLIANYPFNSDQYADSLGTAIIQSSATRFYPFLELMNLGGQTIAALLETKKSTWHPLITSRLEYAYENWDNLHERESYINTLQDPELVNIPGTEKLLSLFKPLITLEKATITIDEENEDTYQEIYDDVMHILKNPSAKLKYPLENVAGAILHADDESEILDSLLRAIIDTTKSSTIIYHVLEHHAERFFPTTHAYIATIPELYGYALNLVDEQDELSMTTLKQIIDKINDSSLLKKIAEKIKEKKLKPLYPIADDILQRLPEEKQARFNKVFHTILEYAQNVCNHIITSISSCINPVV